MQLESSSKFGKFCSTSHSYEKKEEINSTAAFSKTSLFFFKDSDFSTLVIRSSSMRKSSPIAQILALFFLLSSSKGEPAIYPQEIIKDGDTVISPGNRYVLGFFSPGNSTARYMGIWFAIKPTTIAWVANRDNPIPDNSGVLRINATGNLVLSSDDNPIIWSPPSQHATVRITAQLLGSGNFVLTQGETILWQSFDYPTDTMLPGMKIGPDFKNNRDRNLSSWASEDNPATGEFTYTLDSRDTGQPYVRNKTGDIKYRSGPWNGREFSGNHRMRSYTDLIFRVVHNDIEAYYQYDVVEESTLARLVLEPSGDLARFQWDVGANDWNRRWSAPDDSVCDQYARCGPNGVCNSGSSVQCACLNGFEAKDEEQWEEQIWREGCVRRTSLSCGKGDDFVKRVSMKLPDMKNAVVDRTMGFTQCRSECSTNCSCVAYAPANISGEESGCIMWIGELMDLRNFSDGGQDLYLRVDGTDSAKNSGETSNRKRVKIFASFLAGAVVILLLSVFGYLLWKKRSRTDKNLSEVIAEYPLSAYLPGKTLPKKIGYETDEEAGISMFTLDAIALATNQFGNANKIGKGGSGDVYKGQLSGGQLVAVKRISSETGESIAEFTTEVRLIAKLQHRNLVRLLGFCTQGGERLLVYEFMPNRSLDQFIFREKEKRQILDWGRRMEIIVGIARGLLYLHQDSRLRVIHRDLKAANVLLDENMNPKISDFGTARIIKSEQTAHKTVKIVGTIGYMSPEYIMGGKFSEKSDVFSFGVLLLEIISGKRNQCIPGKDLSMELLADAWKLYNEDQCEKLMDSSLDPCCDMVDVKRFILVGLLCVQERPEGRPTMQQVVLMLANKTSALPSPEKPGFFNSNHEEPTHFSYEMYSSSSSHNDITVTDYYGR